MEAWSLGDPSAHLGMLVGRIVHDEMWYQKVTGWNLEALSFSSCRRPRVRVDFSGGSTSSNGGALLLREVDRMPRLSAIEVNTLELRTWTFDVVD